MRTVTYGAACSLDGFIADAAGGLDWLHFSGDVERIIADYWATVDTVLMGRKTWEPTAAQAAAAAATDPPPIATYVFSRTLTAIASPGAHLISTDPAEFLHELKRKPGKGICIMGGGELAQSLFAADLIDEVGLNIHPILLGSGVPLFRDPGRRIALELTESRILDGGCVLANYRVRRSGASRKRSRELNTNSHE